MIVHGIDVYKTYLAFKQHFSNPTFDFFKYDGKVNAKEETYQARNDFYFFETLARKLTDQEVKEYMLASFVAAEDPSKVWIGDIKETGKGSLMEWRRLTESLSYNIERDTLNLLERTGGGREGLQRLMEVPERGHPELLRCFIRKDISFLTFCVFDVVLQFSPDWEGKMRDPLWEKVLFKLRKTKPFLSINREKMRGVILKCVLGT